MKQEIKNISWVLFKKFSGSGTFPVIESIPHNEKANHILVEITKKFTTTKFIKL